MQTEKCVLVLMFVTNDTKNANEIIFFTAKVKFFLICNFFLIKIYEKILFY